MGAYVSKAVTETVDDHGKNDILSYGASSMQGWRMSQEDAHVAILDMDSCQDKTQMFGVFDGHGGAEVAQYAAQYLPSWLKETEEFKSGDFEAALTKGFVSFDHHLVQQDVLLKLKILAGQDPEEDAKNKEEEAEEVKNLYDEAFMPIEELVAKYEKEQPNSIPAHLKKTLRLVSPAVRKKKSDDGAGPSTSGSSKSKPIEEFDSDDEVKAETNGKGDVKPETNGEINHRNGNGIETKENGSTNDTEEETKIAQNQVMTTKSEEVISEKNQVEHQVEPPKKVDKGKRIVKPTPKRQRKETDPETEYASFLADESSEEEEEEDFDPNTSSDDDSEEQEDDSEEEEDSDDDAEEVGMMVEDEINEEPGLGSGCTAVVALLVGDNLYVGNAGDSRCVVSQSGKAVDMSVDHKPEDEIELTRIKKAGGSVSEDGRVNGGLNLSRALGDHTYKGNKDIALEEQMISPLPDVKKITIDSTHDFMVLACDGIWNSMTSQEVVDFVGERLGTKSPVSICHDLFHHCLAPDTTGDGTGCDNMTAIIVTFDKHRAARLDRKRSSNDDSEQLPQAKKAKDEEDLPSSTSS